MSIHSPEPLQRLRWRTRLLQLTFCLCLCALVVWREPLLWVQPRFWAEEATVYFHDAVISAPWLALITPHQGYYALLTNLAAVCAAGVPLAWAPVVTTGFSTAVLMALLVFTVLGPMTFLRRPLHHGMAAFLLLVVGATGEIWLNAINVQHYLVVWVFGVFMRPMPAHAAPRWLLVTLLFAGLSSVSVHFLWPLFAVKWARSRARSDRQVLLVLSLTAAVQVLAMGVSMLGLVDGDMAQVQRFQAPGQGALGIVRTIFEQGWIYPFTGASGAWVLLGWVMSALVLYTAGAAWRDYWPFAAAMVLLATLTVLSSIGMRGGPRYAYAGSVIVAWWVLALAQDVRLSVWVRGLAWAVLAWMSGAWSWQFFTGLKAFTDPAWPVWAQEVSAWQQDPSRPLRVHPGVMKPDGQTPVWTLTLPVGRP